MSKFFLLIIISVLISISIVGCVLYNVYQNISHTLIETTSNLDPVINTYNEFMHYLNEIYQWVKDNNEFLYISMIGSPAVSIQEKFIVKYINYTKFVELARDLDG